MKIKNGTLARTIVLLLALINQVFAIFGIGAIDIADDTIYQLCSLGATIITAGAAWWKNNSFTQAALAGDDTMADEKLKDKVEEAHDGVEETEKEEG